MTEALVPGARPRGGRLASIDAARAVAAIGVVFHHVPRSLEGHGFWGDLALLPTEWGALGVPLFLVISGFCIHLAAQATVNAAGRMQWSAFWKRRILRLYPPYVVAILFVLALYYGTGGASYVWEGNRITNLPVDLASHLLMVQNLSADYHYSLGNGSFWTLALEEQLYALYAVYALMRRRAGPLTLLALTLVVTLTWQYGFVNPLLGIRLGPLGAWYDWPWSWWFSWVLGAVLAESFMGRLELPRALVSLRAAALLLALGLFLDESTVRSRELAPFYAATPARMAWFLVNSRVSSLLCSVAFAIALHRAVAWEQARKGKPLPRGVRLLAWLGTSSYSLYLIHAPLLAWVGQLLFPPESSAPYPVRYLVLVPIAVGTALVFFYAFERPFLSLGRRQRTARP